MPLAPKKPCRHPGCPELTSDGHCVAHASDKRQAARQFDAQRGNSTERLYNAAWKRFRLWFLSHPDNAICLDCHQAPATEVHHVLKVRDRPDLRLTASNCLGLCQSCHAKRTARGE